MIEYISIYGTGTRVVTPDGKGVIRAIYEHKVLVMLDPEYRMKAKFGLPPHRLPFPVEYWNHERPFDFWGSLYSFDELKLILRKWNALRSEEIEALDWDNQSIYWAKKSKKGVITYQEEMPTTLRPTEYSFLCKIKIDLFKLHEKGLAVSE